MPYFHDAYKGWSCCKKKSVDFTEFLNIKGCELSEHSNQKPPEPEKPKQDVVVEEPPPLPSPIINASLARVDFNSPLTLIQPTVAPALKQTIDNIGPTVETKTVVIDSRYWLFTDLTYEFITITNCNLRFQFSTSWNCVQEWRLRKRV